MLNHLIHVLVSPELMFYDAKPRFSIRAQLECAAEQVNGYRSILPQTFQLQDFRQFKSARQTKMKYGVRSLSLRVDSEHIPKALGWRGLTIRSWRDLSK